ncbi:hypothetical protein ERJ75_000931300 [Trypanosoma vivax]|nr:hypothetical protein ERJ75_000931300 [Trypanosoma vivax]
MVRTTTHTKEFSGEVVAPDLSFPVCDSSGPKAEHEETVSTSAAGENDSVERTHWCTVDDSADQSSRCSRRPRQRSHQCPNKTCMPTNCNHVDPPGNELGQLQLVVASRCTSSKGSSGGLNNSADRICNGSGSLHALTRAT